MNSAIPDYRHVGRIFLLALVVVLISSAGLSLGDELPPTEGRTNLAAGKTVHFAPNPRYDLKGKGKSDPSDLTDGKLSQREDKRMWAEGLSVVWWYPGRLNLALDLGQSSRIDEVAIRFCHRVGKSRGGSIPGWIEVLVSDDGEHYHKVAQRSRYDGGATQAFEINFNQDQGSYIHAMRFKGLNATGRWVALRMYGGSTLATDELYVFGKKAGSASWDNTEEKTASNNNDSTGASGFSIRHPQPYFHKPRIVLTTNVTAPLSVGLLTPANLDTKAPLKMTLDLPPGIDLLAGYSGKVKGLSNGGHRYTFTENSPDTDKRWQRLYLRATDWNDGQTGEMRYRFSHDGWESGQVIVPVWARTIRQPPWADRLMFGLGWWSMSGSVTWPNALDNYRAIGLNTFPSQPYPRMKLPDDSPEWQLLEKARQRGFKISTITSPFTIMERKWGQDNPRMYCQFKDGSHSDHICPSYRGKYYDKEIQRFARIMARVQPDFVSADIEPWSGWEGPIDVIQRCTRCQARYQSSGLNSWENWLSSQGDEMWKDLITTARQAVKQAGANDRFIVGGYDFRPGWVYQKVWDFDQLYPKYMDQGQVSTYTALLPEDLELVGNEARASRSKLPASDVMPWISPGDAGTFPGQAFKWALLECYTNGSTGIWFWSIRMWSAESLIAYNRVIRAITPVEDIIADGHLVESKVDGPGRVSGMRNGDQLVLLVADYYDQAEGSVTFDVHLPEDTKVQVSDLLNEGKPLHTTQGGRQRLTIPLHGQRARLLHVKPAK